MIAQEFTRPQEKTGIVRAAHATRRLRQSVEYFLQIERRAADDFKDVSRGGLLLQRFAQIVCTLAQFPEQPCVLDGDHGLLGEIADQFDLLVGGRKELLAVNGYCADPLVFPQHRHDDKRAGAAEFGQLNRVWDAFAVCGGGTQVGSMNRLLGSDRGGQRGLRMRTKGLVGARRRKRRRRIVERGLTYQIVLDQNHRSEFGAANAGRVFEHLVEYGSQIARRRTDDLQHFGRCSLLLQRFAQIIRALLHFIEQPRILDGDDRLVRKRGNQIDLLFGERLRLDPRQEDHANHFPFPQQRDTKRRPVASQFLCVVSGVVRTNQSIRDMDTLPVDDSPPYHTASIDAYWVGLDKFVIFA